MANSYYPIKDNKNKETRILSSSQYKEIQESNTFERLKRSYNLVNRYASSTNWYTKFSRYGMLDAHNAMTPTREYLFFTRPDLFLTNKSGDKLASYISTSSPYLADTIVRYPSVVQQLQASNTASGLGSYPFAPLLSNALAPDSSLELPDFSGEVIDGPTNVYGTKIFYRGSSNNSNKEFDFSLEFIDSKFLDVYTYFRIYEEYENLKSLGLVDYTGSDGKLWQKYAENRIMHDAFSIYKLVVADDGMSLVYWARVTGVIPTSVPRSAMSDMSGNGEGQKLSVGFKAHFVKDMDPIILRDFNMLNDKGRSANDNTLDLFDSRNGFVNADWALRAKIVKHTENGTYGKAPNRKYYLTWQT